MQILNLKNMNITSIYNEIILTFKKYKNIQFRTIKNIKNNKKYYY